MKKLFFLLTCLSVFLLFASCGDLIGNAETDDLPQTSETEAKTELTEETALPGQTDVKDQTEPTEEIGTLTDPEGVSLYEKYPEYFDLNTEEGLTVFVWQMAENSYSYGLAEGRRSYLGIYSSIASVAHDSLNLMMSLKGISADQMKEILASYDISDENVFVEPCQMIYSSYIADIWVHDAKTGETLYPMEDYIREQRDKLGLE